MSSGRLQHRKAVLRIPTSRNRGDGKQENRANLNPSIVLELLNQNPKEKTKKNPCVVMKMSLEADEIFRKEENSAVFIDTIGTEIQPSFFFHHNFPHPDFQPKTF